MPKIIVEIEYDSPRDPYWLNPDNVVIALSAYCVNTKFKANWAKNGNPWVRPDKELSNKEKRISDPVDTPNSHDRRPRY